MTDMLNDQEDILEKIGNSVQRRREALLLSKAELARKAGVSALTIDRVEKGSPCRMDTKRKILLALGLKLSDRKNVFFDETEAGSGSQEDTDFSFQQEMVQSSVGILTSHRESRFTEK